MSDFTTLLSRTDRQMDGRTDGWMLGAELLELQVLICNHGDITVYPLEK